jgi:hypothetical protein
MCEFASHFFFNGVVDIHHTSGFTLDHRVRYTFASEDTLWILSKANEPWCVATRSDGPVLSMLFIIRRNSASGDELGKVNHPVKNGIGQKAAELVVSIVNLNKAIHLRNETVCY